jgi:hypothetical protein
VPGRKEDAEKHVAYCDGQSPSKEPEPEGNASTKEVCPPHPSPDAWNDDAWYKISE